MEDEWDLIWSKKTGLTDYEAKWYNFLSIFKDSKYVLEVGCGSGRGLAEFNNVVVGIDISKKAIKKSKETLSDKNAFLVIGDAKNLPFKENAFDFTVSSGLIEHFKNEDKDDEKMVDEMVKVTKRGGKLLISVPNTFCVWYTIAKPILYSLKLYPYHDESSYNFLELENMLKSRYLKVIKSHGLQLFPHSFTGFNRIYPKWLADIFDKVESNVGPINKVFAFAVICLGEKQ